MISMAEAIEQAGGKRTIAIDGLPASGKSTLAERLASELGAVCLFLDDFVIPEDLWPRPLLPAYPFPYFRHAAFIAAAAELATNRLCQFQPYDWASGQLAAPHTIDAQDRPVIIEGVSALDPALAPLYDLRLWIESDAASTLDAALARGKGQWATEWRYYFLPSAEHYMITRPQDRADRIVAGRGA
ncbi:uridine kinase family protein [Devosia salina]|uniref:Uridine kinase n=1 Tax=Devosia salina TaxID=2860336 RepID=A0ABX8WDJ4_9HYPH|nr:hypothetical protein [Devosia salina]QYO76752.1 hypothetical protein K1X15_19615 [Devosia salina]